MVVLIGLSPRMDSGLALAVQGVTAMVEIVARNAIDRTLTAWCQETYPSRDWFDLGMLDEQAKADISAARARVRRRDQSLNHDRVVAELSFGFWRFLTTRRYHASLWVPALHKAFPYADPDLRTRQREVAHLLGTMSFVRNRAAHLEPLFRRSIHRDVKDGRMLMGWIDPQARAWFDDTVQIDNILANTPAFLR